MSASAFPRPSAVPADALPSPSVASGVVTRLRWDDCDRSQYIADHLDGLQPAVVLGAIDHWPSREKWTPQFFKDCYGALEVTIDGRAWRLAELIDRIVASTPEHPAPYLRNQPLGRWPRELLADVSPLPRCIRPNYLESPLFPARGSQISLELYIGGAGAAFPTLHYDFRHMHAFLMQLHGRKEYVVFAPDQERYLYPRPGIEGNKSSIPDIENVDRARFPLYAHAKGMRFLLNAGETLFVPGGWWHTARILTTSITVSVNGASAGNWVQYRRDYCAGIAQRSPIKAGVVNAYLALLGVLLSIFET